MNNFDSIWNQIFEFSGAIAKSYKDEIYAYYGWSWSQSAFYNVISVLACFEFLVEDCSSALESVRKGIEIMTDSIRPYIQNYDSSIIDPLDVRRRRKDLHSLHLFRNGSYFIINCFLIFHSLNENNYKPEIGFDCSHVMAFLRIPRLPIWWFFAK